MAGGDGNDEWSSLYRLSGRKARAWRDDARGRGHRTNGDNRRCPFPALLACPHHGGDGSSSPIFRSGLSGLAGDIPSVGQRVGAPAQIDELSGLAGRQDAVR